MAEIDVDAPRQAKATDRGQMILVTGIILAVLFVALALLVNAAIYTDNVATRGGDSAGEALEYQTGIVDSVGGLIDAENPRDSTDEDTTAVNVELPIETIVDSHRQYHLRRGAMMEANWDINEGRLIHEPDREGEGLETWDAEASAVRGFVVRIDTSEMPTAETEFRIDLDGTKLSVNKTDSGLVVEGGTEGIRCETPANGEVVLDVVGEQLAGEPCQFGLPTFADGSRIGIENGPNGAGSYDLAIRSEADPGTFPSALEVTRFVYDVELDLLVSTPELRYDRAVYVTSEVPNV